MLKKEIVYFGQKTTVICDGRCDKAWGINSRPQLFYMESGEPPRKLKADEEPLDYDDNIFVGDDELGTAPADPGTYEGGHGKPSATPLDDSSSLNKWCVRECERSAIDAKTPPDLLHPLPNIRSRHVS